jgi:PhzF family phenazine biosynthesis protein
MGVQIIQADAFTNQAFSGNPAAVCLLNRAASKDWMQNVAREMNLSETAFVYPEKDGFRLRWFTPAVEVSLCGHATLASAHALWEEQVLSAGAQAIFYTKSGVLTAEKQDCTIQMDFPVDRESPVEAPSELLDGLGTAPTYVGKNRFDYLVEIASEELLRDLKPDFGALMKVPARGVIVTSVASQENFDFVSRFFAPQVGVNEDPVTGSAHCCLGPFWGARLKKNVLVGYQASARGGIVHVSLSGDRVYIGGQAVTVWKGELIHEPE